jgi:hypothetical protein
VIEEPTLPFDLVPGIRRIDPVALYQQAQRQQADTND